MEISRRNFVAAVIAGIALPRLSKALGDYDPHWQMPIGVWLRHELHVFVHPKHGSMELRIDGRTRYYATDIDTSKEGMRPASHFLVGCDVRYGQRYRDYSGYWSPARMAANRLFLTFGVLQPRDLGPGGGIDWKFIIPDLPEKNLCSMENIYVAGDQPHRRMTLSTLERGAWAYMTYECAPQPIVDLSQWRIGGLDRV
jgi:hypothetical protein